MRCNYNLNIQQSEVTSSTTMYQGGEGGLGFLVTSVSLLSVRQPGRRDGAGWIISIIYIQSTFLFIFFTFVIRHSVLFSLCFLRCVENFETKIACERCCLWEGLSTMHVQGSNFFSFFCFLTITYIERLFVDFALLKKKEVHMIHFTIR